MSHETRNARNGPRQSWEEAAPINPMRIEAHTLATERYQLDPFKTPTEPKPRPPKNTTAKGRKMKPPIAATPAAKLAEQDKLGRESAAVRRQAAAPVLTAAERKTYEELMGADDVDDDGD